MGGWQQARADLNHGWLKNRFLDQLRTALVVGEDGRIDPEYFLSEILPGWERNSSAIVDLILSFEKAESPVRLLNEDPLRRLSTEDCAWLGQVVHAGWLARCQVAALVEDALAAHEEVSGAASRLSALIGKLPVEGPVEEDHPVAFELRDLLAKTRPLGNALSAFPHTLDLGGRRSEAA